MAAPTPPVASGHQDALVLAAINQHVYHYPQLSSGKDWVTARELPSVEEVLQKQDDCEALPHNSVDKAWTSKEAYLETLYKILRREGVEGLRFSVNCFRRDPAMMDDKNTCIYTDVRVKGYLLTRIGPVCRVAFSTRRAGRKIKWEQSRRLTPGTAIAITTQTDNFKSICKIATVAQRPVSGGLDLDPPEIDIFWADVNDAVFNPSEELIIVESRNGYFEAVRHALVGLQHAAETHSALDKYLVRASKDDTAAAFIQKSPHMDVSGLVNQVPESVDRSNPAYNEATEFIKAGQPLKSHDILSGVPSVKDVSTLDDSQLEALHRIVSKELAIVQGPPGTGKTFTSVSALKVTLANRSLIDPPIVIAAQTNHALDQLLMLCHEAGANILRVGGRTDNPTIASRTMYSLRNITGLRPDRTFKGLEATRRSNTDDIQRLVEGVFSGGLLHPAVLLDTGAINEAQHDSIMSNEWESADDTPGENHQPLAEWLGEQCIPTEHLTAVPDFLEEEEEDEREKEYEIDVSLDQIAEDDEEKNRLRGTYIPFTCVLTGRVAGRGWRGQAEKSLATCNDFYDIPQYIRGGVYRLLQTKVMETLTPKFHRLLADTNQICKKIKVNKWARDINVVREQCINIVGCTTTGLTKYRGFISAMLPKTLLIEEAAETREANIASALYESLEQLILVGDHQQLTPHCDIRYLGGDPYFLNTSLFERLVGLGLPYTMLNQQRRMRPELRYILNSFYPKLTDHPEVQLESKRPCVPGMGGRNCWLFDHQWPEDTDSDNSKFNIMEAEMITKFVAYLMQNGVPGDHITILTFYNGQRKTILRMLKREPAISNMGTQTYKVHTVDSYQGEENEIVLLSLVRSPKPDHGYAVGFLEDKNRAVVAISRARRGFYVFGNVANVLLAHEASYQLWGQIWNGFADQKSVRRNKGIPTICQNHAVECWFKEPNDFVGNAGGCTRDCVEILPCGHACKLHCHPTSHATLACLEPCRRILSCGHNCENLCTDKCYCSCGQYQPPMQLGFHMGTVQDIRLELSPTGTRSSEDKGQKILGGSKASVVPTRSIPIRGGPKSRGGYNGGAVRGGRGGALVTPNPAFSRQTSPTPRDEATSDSSGDHQLWPGTTTSALVSREDAIAKWQSFTKQPHKHDEKLRQERLSESSKEPSPEKTTPVLKETYQQTELVNGRRSTGKRVGITNVNNGSVSVQPLPSVKAKAPKMAKLSQAGRTTPPSSERAVPNWLDGPASTPSSRGQSSTRETAVAATATKANMPQAREDWKAGVRQMPAMSGLVRREISATEGHPPGYTKASSAMSDISGSDFGFEAEVLGIRRQGSRKLQTVSEQVPVAKVLDDQVANDQVPYEQVTEEQAADDDHNLIQF